MQADPDHAVKGGGTLPAGWSARTDRNAPLDVNASGIYGLRINHNLDVHVAGLGVK